MANPAVPSPAVFDASALLAILYNEPGAENVIGHLHGALVSSVNLTELYSRLLAADHPSARSKNHIWNRILSMGFEVIAFSEDQARRAGELFQNFPTSARFTALSLGERACLALAIERKATVYTANPAWKSLSGVSANLDVIVIA